jgi:hypothetical protein
MGFTQICSFFSSINLLFFVFSFCADSWAVSVLFGCIPLLIGKWLALPS